MAGGRRLRVQVRRPQAPSGPPLLLLNGIGAPLDLLDPFVDALPADREIIRFDPPGIGGSPDVVLPYHLTTSPRSSAISSRSSATRAQCSATQGRRPGPAVAVCRPAQVRRLVFATSTGALSVRRARACSAGSSAPLAAGPHGRAGRRRRPVRRDGAHAPGTRRGGTDGDRRGAPPPARLRPAARRDPRLDEPARAPADPGTDAGDRGDGRPDHPDRERDDPRTRAPRRARAPPAGRHLAIVTEARELAGVAAEFLGAP